MTTSRNFNQLDEIKRSKVNLTTSKILTLSNALSLLRIVLFLPFIYFYERDEKVMAFAVVLLAISTDWFDGRVARWTNTVSELGKILDPFADKFSAALMGIYLLYRGELPLWFVGLVVVRDAIIFLGGIYVKQKKHVITTALPAGKWAVGFLAGAIGGTVYPYQSQGLKLAVEISIYIASALFVVSFLQYAKRFFDILQDKPVQNL
ncbi:MAG: CDP-alcohol phosphatidyltransferase family protein [Chloroherpetonaceae bacterium]